MLLKHVVVAKHVVAEPVVAENINAERVVAKCVVAKRVVVEAEAGAYLGALPAKDSICVTQPFRPENCPKFNPT